MAGKSNTQKRAAKVAKPRADYPLTPHPTGRWCKKIRGNLYYFGKIDDPDAAEANYNARKDDISAGVDSRHVARGEACTVRSACNEFLNAKRQRMESGEITKRHFNDLVATTKLMARAFGALRSVASLRPTDFDALRAKLAKDSAAWTLSNAIQRIRSVFKYALEAGLIDTPVRYGPSFKRPTKGVMRRERAEKGERLFEASDLRRLVKAAGPQLRAMVLLGVNCGLGNSDCGQLQFRHLDLGAAWLTFPRPKTGIGRKCKLWPETVKALQAAIAKRPTPKDTAHAELVFITKYGQPWAKDAMANPVSHQFRKLLVKLAMHREGLSFYTLRHQFETIAGGCRDQVAVDHAMGHSDPSMASHYRENIGDDRLEAVAEHVRKWYLKTKPKAKSPRLRVVAAG